MRRAFTGTALALLLGCQTGSTGGMRVAVAFPALRVQTVPAAATQIPVVVDHDGVTVASTMLTRAQPRATVTGIPAGQLTVFAAALGSDQEVLAIGKAPVTISAGRLTAAEVELLPILVFGRDERMSIMSSVRKGFPIEFGMSIKPLPPGGDTVPGSLPSSRPGSPDLQLGTLTAQPATATLHYPVTLSVPAGPDSASLGLWDWEWQVASMDTTLPAGQLSSTRLVGGRAEAVWTPAAAGTYVLRLIASDGTRKVTSNDVTVTVESGSAGGSIGGNF